MEYSKLNYLLWCVEYLGVLINIHALQCDNVMTDASGTPVQSTMVNLLP